MKSRVNEIRGRSRARGVVVFVGKKTLSCCVCFIFVFPHVLFPFQRAVVRK